MLIYGASVLVNLTEESKEEDPNLKGRGIGLVVVGLLLVPPGGAPPASLLFSNFQPRLLIAPSFTKTAYELWQALVIPLGLANCCRRRRAPASPSWTTASRH